MVNVIFELEKHEKMLLFAKAGSGNVGRIMRGMVLAYIGEEELNNELELIEEVNEWKKKREEVESKICALNGQLDVIKAKRKAEEKEIEESMLNAEYDLAQKMVAQP